MTLRKISLYILVLLVMLKLASCYPVDDDGKPFEFGASYGSAKKAPLKAGDKFDLRMDIEVVRPVRNVKIMLVIPKEVEVEEYAISTLIDINIPLVKHEGPFKATGQNIVLWEGNLAPDKMNIKRKESTWKNASIFLRTKTDGVKWSEPIRGWIELDYEREGKAGPGIQRVESGHYKEDFSWTHKVWEGKNGN